ncbi:MAG: hypothetical protein DRI01_10335 [Chloroflexi bacterium]|nr:MAG: hypothetical protein DRI01_10335 [Chloroflexota bacterium]
MGETLPRKVRLETGESILKQSGANLQIGFFIPIGGRLFLTSKRLIFIPGRFNISPEKPEKVTLTLGSINRVEKKTRDMSNLLAGSFRSRLQVQSRDKLYILQVWDLNNWLKALKTAITSAF